MVSIMIICIHVWIYYVYYLYTFVNHVKLQICCYNQYIVLMYVLQGYILVFIATWLSHKNQI